MFTRRRNHKYLFLVIICILMVSLPGLSGCQTTTPPPTTEPAPPPPEPATPGRGAVTGQVMFRDGMPAQGSKVVIFKEEGTVSFASCDVDVDGYYFSDLPVGNYDLYATADVERTLFFGLAPDAQITVSEYETTTVPTITIRRHIDITCEEEYLTTTQPQLSWEAVPTAKYYLVEVWSWAEGYEREYEKKIQVSDTQVTWSVLTPAEYHVRVEAYDEQDTSIGTGYDSFWIGPRLPSED